MVVVKEPEEKDVRDFYMHENAEIETLIKQIMSV